MLRKKEHYLNKRKWKMLVSRGVLPCKCFRWSASCYFVRQLDTPLTISKNKGWLRNGIRGSIIMYLTYKIKQTQYFKIINYLTESPSQHIKKHFILQSISYFLAYVVGAVPHFFLLFKFLFCVLVVLPPWLPIHRRVAIGNSN